MRSAPSFRIDPLALANGQDVVGTALKWAAAHIGNEPILIYATATPDDVKRTQTALGVEKSASLVEHALATIAAGLVDLGVNQLIVAGGETSGAVLHALGVKRLRDRPRDRSRGALDDDDAAASQRVERWRSR